MKTRCADTALPVIEKAFKDLSDRDDVGIILINQHVGTLKFTQRAHTFLIHLTRRSSIRSPLDVSPYVAIELLARACAVRWQA